ncbi:MAG TPA: response regulator transcription factor [Conexibacter sp.]|nr:response regulator transcription factor [Conexibacter sp.]
MTEPRILVAEDDLELRDLLLTGLRHAGFDAAGVSSGTDLLARTASWTPHALIVDVGLPDADGRDVCQALRAAGNPVPVLFLTARDTRADRLAGFGAGGDDYVTKPFDFAEVIARIHALLRRADPPAPPLDEGWPRLDPASHAAHLGEQSVTLTPTEFRLLAALAARRGEAVRRRTLIAAAWPEGAIVHDNTLDVYIARLRRKLATLGAEQAITNVYGVGFTLR